MVDLKSLNPDQRQQLLGTVYKQLWQRWELDHLRHAKQLEFKARFNASKGRKFYLNNSRRWGKSHELVLQALETCGKIPGARVLYLCEHGNAAAEIATDLIQKILMGVDDKGVVNPALACPASLVPHYSNQKKEFMFGNGSILRLKGTNGQEAKNLRGLTQDLIILDEAANMEDLEYIVGSILMPMFMTKPNGKMLIATTPARTPSHYTTRLFEECSRTGDAITYTIADIPHVPDDTKIEFLQQAGENHEHAEACIKRGAYPISTTARREYYCEFVSDSSLAIFPEFNADARAEIVKDWTRPDYFEPYTAMDPGSVDNTGILFYYYDFLNAKLVVVDELLLNNPSTVQIAEAITQKEQALWGKRQEVKRVCDVDPRMIADMSQMYGLKFQSARNKDVLADVNFVRHLITSRMLVIAPNCVGLIRQLQNVIWNNSGKDFFNDRDGIDKHYDLVAALKYGARFVNFKANPFPDSYWGAGSPLSSLKRAKPNSSFSVRGNTPIDKKLARSGKKRA